MHLSRAPMHDARGLQHHASQPAERRFWSQLARQALDAMPTGDVPPSARRDSIQELRRRRNKSGQNGHWTHSE